MLRNHRLGQQSTTNGPTEITVTALEPTELKPYTEGADVVISVYNKRQPAALTEVARGKTDAQGKYVWNGQAPGPNLDYRYKVSVSIPGGTPKSFDVPARDPSVVAAGGGQVSKSSVLWAACPSNIDPLVCAVAEAQLFWKDQTAKCALAWGTSAQAQSFCADQAHAVVPLNHPKLAARRDAYSWWVGDLGIPPKDWPALVGNVDQTMEIFSSIPFPEWPGIEDLFTRCARGVPITQGKNGENLHILNPRLYSATYSEYFPRDSKQIARDMAAAYLGGVKSVFLCMEHRIRQKIKETERTMRAMSIMSFGVVLINAPFLIAFGASGFTVLATEVYDFYKGLRGETGISYGVTAALATAASLAGDPDLVIKALEPIVNELLVDMDPVAAQAVKAVYPQVVRAAFDAVAGSAASQTASGATTVTTGAASSSVSSIAASVGATVAPMVAAMAIKAMAMIPKMYAAERIKELGDAAAGAQMAAQDMLKFVSLEEVSPIFKPFLIWVAEAMDIEGLINDAIDQFLDQFNQALQAGADQGGDVAVVPEEGGGGVDIVPTDSEGTPTDVNGNPLPGGVAPETPPSGGGVIPGVEPPPLTGVGSDIGAIAGISGATMALLLATGAVTLT